MEVLLLLAADYANVEQHGKLNVMGIFDHINATAFPVKHAMMHLVIKLAPQFGEPSQTRHINIKLLDEDGGELVNLRQHVEVPPLSGGRRPDFNFILGLRDVSFPHPGTYEFIVLIDGDLKASLPIYLNQIEPS